MFGFRKKKHEKRTYFFDRVNNEVYEVVKKDGKIIRLRKLYQAY